MHLFLYYREMLYSTISKSDLGHFVPAGGSQPQSGIHGAACWSIALFQNVSHFHEKYHLCFHLLFFETMIGILQLKVFQAENLGVVQGKGAAAKTLASSPSPNPIFFQDPPLTPPTSVGKI